MSNIVPRLANDRSARATGASQTSARSANPKRRKFSLIVAADRAEESTKIAARRRGSSFDTHIALPAYRSSPSDRKNHAAKY